MPENYSSVWSLDSAFTGGSSSPAFAAELEKIKVDIDALFDQLVEHAEEITDPPALIMETQDIAARIYTCAAYIGCLTAADIEDKQAQLLQGSINELAARISDILVIFAKTFTAISDTSWPVFVADERLKDIVFNLNEMRHKASDLMALDKEILANALSVNGFSEWSTLYDRLVASVRISSADAHGVVTELSAGQALNRLGDPNIEVRNALLPLWEQAWQNLSDLGAVELNALAGYRLALYRARGWDSFLKETLELNRMSEATLNAMWDTITANKAKLVAYVQRKKELLGVEQLSWADFDSPLTLSSESKSYSFTEGADFVIAQFESFSPKMAAFVREALSKRWVEAEDRPRKGIGAFCTGFLTLGEQRVFMTYDGTLGSISTLAHELGHAFHGDTMKNLPMMAQDIGMSVAETASTFAETVVTNAALAEASTLEEKIMLMESKINRAAVMMMNIHARFIFEYNFYAARQKSQVPAAQLNQLMLDAQLEAYAGALDIWHPTFWLSKGHFHGTYIPFYNFPYTFGFLFANGIYSEAQHTPGGFEDRYVDLLRHTGSMSVEDLAKKYLDADLTQSDFWQSAIDAALEDYDTFMELSAQYLAERK